ncbi:hypothetical protein ACYULU_08565 [Breznakiellaceae bacterium SP9]
MPALIHGKLLIAAIHEMIEFLVASQVPSYEIADEIKKLLWGAAL